MTAPATDRAAVAVRVVDCDVHPLPRHPGELRAHLPPQWLARCGESFSYAVGRAIYLPPNRGLRVDASPETGGPPGSDPELLERQLLVEAGVDYAILIPIIVGIAPDPDYTAAMHAAVNSWLAETWLTAYNAHARYRGTLSVPVNSPAAAVREIERWAGHPYFVQVQVPHNAQPPYGHRMYDPIWAAASRHGLPVGVHVNGGGTGAVASPVGFVQYFAEFHAISYPLTYAAHLTSLICEGAFERFRDLRFVFMEGGINWAGPLMWRLDKNWRRLRAEVPELTRPPGEYLYEHVRFTSQPIEAPERQELLPDMWELYDATRLLLFATDYPHFDFDDPRRAVPRLPPAARRRVMWENAVELYGLPRQRAA